MKLFWKHWRWPIVCMLVLALLVGLVVQYRSVFHYTGAFVLVESDTCKVMSLSDGAAQSFTAEEYCEEYGVSVLRVSGDEEGSAIHRYTPDETVYIATIPLIVHGVPAEIDGALYFLGSKTYSEESVFLYRFRNGALEKAWDGVCHGASGVVALDGHRVLLTEYRGMRDRFFVDGVLTVLDLQTGETEVLCGGSLPSFDPVGQRLFF